VAGVVLGVVSGCSVRALPSSAGRAPMVVLPSAAVPSAAVPSVLVVPLIPSVPVGPGPSMDVTTVTSPWLEMDTDLPRAPLRTEAQIHQAVAFLAGIYFRLSGAPPWSVVFVRTTYGAVDDPWFDPSGLILPAGGRVPAARTPVVLIKVVSDVEPAATRGETLIMLDATDSSLLQEFTMMAMGDPGELDSTDWGRYGKLVTLVCGFDFCLCRPKACTE